MTAPTTTPAAEQYLADVEHELADLPADERAELLEDLGLHLAALEEEADERPLAARLGSPADYAAELRVAAGLPPRRTGANDESRLRAATRRGRRFLVSVGDRQVVREIRSFVPQLRPAWWVLRGYLVVLVPNLWHIDGSSDFPVPAPAGSHVLGVVLVALAVVASVAVGRRRLPRLVAVGVLAGNLALLVAAGNLLSDWQWRSADNQVVYVASRVDPFRYSPLVTPRGPVTNIRPYAADGTPLEGVLLFDQDGRPLPSGQQLWWADHCRRVLSPPRAVDGTPVGYSYPKTYVLDPEGKSLSGLQLTPGQCKALTAPKVVLPVLTKPTASPAPQQAAAKPVAKK
ncbi:MAG: hypothetical protein QOE05_3036 [Actinomycetota bacterium]|jgi:hypothetical protein|nr:hypothetical protein [Actinomycetota bacterium]